MTVRSEGQINGGERIGGIAIGGRRHGHAIAQSGKVAMRFETCDVILRGPLDRRTRSMVRIASTYALAEKPLNI